MAAAVHRLSWRFTFHESLRITNFALRCAWLLISQYRNRTRAQRNAGWWSDAGNSARAGNVYHGLRLHLAIQLRQGAEIEGFLLNDHTLIHLPPRAADRAGSLLRRGDSVQITGFSQTSPTRFQTIEAQAVQDRTSGKTLTVPQPGPAAPFSGSGRIEHLNYSPDGAVNGFLLDSGTLLSVAPFSSTNPSSIRVGVPITYSGLARNTMSGRMATDVQTLSINGQTLMMGEVRPVHGPGAPPPPPLRRAGRVIPESPLKGLAGRKTYTSGRRSHNAQGECGGKKNGCGWAVGC